MSRSKTAVEKGSLRSHPAVLILFTIAAMTLALIPLGTSAYGSWQHNATVNSDTYMKQYGHWDILNIPDSKKINAIHAAMLPTGKVLLVAGSGNNRSNFDAYNDTGVISVLKTLLYDPATNSFTNIETPSDLFCSGHALLQSGDLLVAGGTVGYEQLDGQVKKPAGAMIIHNENPDDKVRTIAKGTQFVDTKGRKYLSTQTVILPPAQKMDHGDGLTMVMHSSVTVFVEAEKEDSSYITSDNQKYEIAGLSAGEQKDIYGQGGPMTLNKQDYRGDNKSYEFDPWTEKYVRVGDMNVGRWYPSLPVLTNGKVIAVSGLDNTGQITKTTESYSDFTQSWTLGSDQAFATYPALFRTTNPDVLFYSGSNAGYGPADQGRTPGFWNVTTNTFSPVSGLRDPLLTETSASVVLPPLKGSNDGSQSSRIMIAGGGGIGESNIATARTDIIDLSAETPKYTPGPDLASPLRYLNMTVLPTDDVLLSGGTGTYRAKNNSYSLKTSMIDSTGKASAMADELVGRSYHSGSLLLPNGKVLVFGNDPLYSDKENTIPGVFDQRIEIYTPPQLYQGTRPVLTDTATKPVHRGDTLTYRLNDGQKVQTARLITPSTTTHVTNVEQRSVGVVASQSGSEVSIKLGQDENQLPNGWYMLFVTNDKGIPSEARMIQVTP